LESIVDDASAPAPQFQPEMPRIPGVGKSEHKIAPRTILIIVVAVAVALAGGGTWSVLHRRPVTSAPTVADLPAAPVVPAPAAASGGDPAAIASLDELGAPWSSKQFTFIDPATHVTSDAIVVNLPGNKYWAFSLTAPYSTCALQYVTDLGALASRYRFRATHPMVVNSCDGTIYDLLRAGPSPEGALVRGEIVSGSGIRPPLAIEVHARGRYLYSGRME
jgi:hypothetical protein